MEQLNSAQKKESEITCSFCVHSSVSAVKTCLHCEASLCEEHVRIHSKSNEHVLVEPSTPIQERKCSIHNKLIEFYCNKDGACICVSCCIVGDHKGHEMDQLPVAFEKNKVKLENILTDLTESRVETEKRLEKLEEKRRDVQEEAAGVTKRVSTLFNDIRGRLDELEKQAFSEITRQEQETTLRVANLIKQLESKKNEMSDKICKIEELKKITDPLTALKNSFNEEKKRRGSRKMSETDTDAKLVGHLNEVSLSFMLQMGLQSLAGSLLPLKAKQQFPDVKPTEVTLDVKTAHNKIIISSDLKTATYTATPQKYPDGPERFRTCQVLSSPGFSSGQHYWEVDVSQAKRWIVGVACESIQRKIAGNDSFIGYNNKSWSLFFQNYLGVSHNNVQQTVVSDTPVQALGIYLDYDAGQMSFFQLGETLHLLHTYSATFTEPLHPAFFIFEGSSIRIKS
ncbi:E3 ubiquitin ISG15 ligase TRIM25-like [Pelobates cultripes]|uniref:E3 ubiquitin ISG15 ligase TRIM25-like n=1 Tax=Pelobates cultripes TaxID=61616 RepID=A0AAD1WIM7_PELCU|nr:E3 ubiquitin ISG15 ligase TRIM25-like [Pelobates cultripes]